MKFCPARRSLTPSSCIRAYDKILPLARIGDSGFHTVANWSLIEEALGREQDFSANLTGVLYRGADGHPDCFALPYGLLLQAFLD